MCSASRGRATTPGRARQASRRTLVDRELSTLIGRVFVGSLETYGAPPCPRRAASGARHSRRTQVGRPPDAPTRPRGCHPAREAAPLDHSGIPPLRRRRDLVARRFTAERPDRLWLAEITYLPTHEGVALPRRRPGRLQPSRGRLVDARRPQDRPGRRRARNGGDPAQAARRCRPPLRQAAAA